MTQVESIPRTIHYCWYGPARISPLGQSCIESWRKTMPDYAIERWDESRLDRSIPYVDMAYRARKFAFVADYMRFKTLHDHGGIYLDTDVEAIRPFDELLGESLFLGVEQPGKIGAGVIGATPGQPFLKLVLERLNEEAARRAGPSYQPIPELVTQLARANPGCAPTLFPEDYFYPYNPFSPVELRRKPLQSNMSERTFAIHHWEGTWLAAAPLGMLIALRIKTAARKLNPMRRRSPQSLAALSNP